MPVCTETPASKDLDRINEALNALDGSSLLIELQKVFKPVPDYLASNAKAEHLPRTYNKNPYIYNLSNYVVPIDVSSVNISTFQEHGLSNALSGAIPGTSHQAQTTPTYLSPYTTLYTKDFILNLV